jgi:cob(I)alamin adenosyltransferase
MKIYTKFGDKGQTSLYGGQVVAKDHPRIEAYGTLDELNSNIGLAACSISDEHVVEILTHIQNDLFRISSILATPEKKNNGKYARNISGDDITYLEKKIDMIDENLPALKSFILPGGSDSAAKLHLARTVCRRGERHLIHLSHEIEVDPDIIIYINRLSDLLFVMARHMNHINNVPDIPWKNE